MLLKLDPYSMNVLRFKNRFITGHKLMQAILLVVFMLVSLTGFAQIPREIIQDELRLIQDTNSHKISLYYKDKLVARNIGVFEVYNWNGFKRTRVYRGPHYRFMKKISDNIFFYEATDVKGMLDFKLRISLKPGNILQLKLRMRTLDKWPTGMQFNLAKLVPDWLQGAKVKGELSDDVYPNLPVQAVDMDDRYLLSNLSFVDFQSMFYDMNVVDINEQKSISLADFRNIPWDKTKSFLLYTSKKAFIPGVWYKFEFEIKINQPSLQFDSTSNAALTKNSVVESRSHASLKVFKTDSKNNKNDYILSNSENLYLKSSDQYINNINNMVELLLGVETVKKHWIERDELTRGIFLNCSDINNQKIRSDGFKLSVTNKIIEIIARDINGCFNAIKSLPNLMKIKNDKRVVPEINIIDEPDINVRGQVIRLSAAKINDVDIFKRYIDSLVKAKANTVVIYHPPEHVALLKNYVHDSKWWSRDQLIEVISYAKQLGLNVIPGMLSKYKAKYFSGLVSPKSNIYCINNKRSYDMVFSLYDVLIDIYQPKEMLIGHDEIKNIGSCVNNKLSGADLFSKDINVLHEWLTQRKIKVLMWGDMLLNHSKWNDIVGSANSNNPVYNSGNTHEAIDRIPKDIVILDWHYQVKPDYRSIKYFIDKGFKVWGVSWYKPQNAVNMAKSIDKYGADGLLGSDWGFWNTLSPGATSLYPLFSGWNLSTQVLSNGESAVSSFAADLRKPIPQQNFIPVELNNVNETVWDTTPGDGVGFFDQGAGLDFRFFPVGSVSFNEMSFKILDSQKGKKNNIIVVGNGVRNDKNLIDTFDIPLNGIKARKIAFLHTMYVETPNVYLKKIGKYVVNYSDESSHSIDLYENYNITDVRSSPGLRKNVWGFTIGNNQLVGSYLPWQGRSLSGIPLNIQNFLWKNPYPNKNIKSIKVVASNSKQHRKIALIALSYEKYE